MSKNVQERMGKKPRSEVQRAALEKCNAARLDDGAQGDAAKVSCWHVTPCSCTNTVTPLLHMPQEQVQGEPVSFGGGAQEKLQEWAASDAL